MGSIAATRKRKSQAFAASAIVAQPFPPNPLVGKTKRDRRSKDGLGYCYARITRDGRQYNPKMDALRAWLSKFGLDKRRRETILAYCKNWYVKKKTLPSKRTLQKLFSLPKE